VILVVMSTFSIADAYTKNQTDAFLSDMVTRHAGVGFDFYGDETTLLAQKGNTAIACNNQELVIADYQELFDNIGTIFDTFNGAVAPAVGSFRAPPQAVDGLGLFNRGVGTSNGVVGTYQADVFKSHDHAIYNDGSDRGSSTSGAYTSGGALVGSKTTAVWRASLTGDTAETRPRSLTVLKCVWTGK